MVIQTADHYAVMGNPIAHSLSPEIHQLFAQETQQIIYYEKLLVSKNGFIEATRQFFHAGGKGLSVTTPFKEQAYQLADKLNTRARKVGAVNTLMLSPDQKILGDNTDGIGLVRDLQDNHRFKLRNKVVLLMGAGGAARGVIPSLLAKGVRRLHIVNRTVPKALHLVAMFSIDGSITAGGYETLGEFDCDLIINATSASLHGESVPLPEHIITPSVFCYDVVYGTETVFLQWARQLGARKCVDGLGMLVEQAAEAFYAWRGVRPATQPVIEKLRR